MAFWAGRNKYVHVPPTGLRRVLEVLREDGCAALGRLSGIYVFVAVFWSLYDQSGSAWVQQAERGARRDGNARETPKVVTRSVIEM